MKRPIVFSLFREQTVFMTAVMGIMTFLAVMAVGISVAIGNLGVLLTEMKMGMRLMWT